MLKMVEFSSRFSLNITSLSTPAAKPTAGILGPPSISDNPSYRPPPKTVPCEPNLVVINSKVV